MMFTKQMRCWLMMDIQIQKIPGFPLAQLQYSAHVGPLEVTLLDVEMVIQLKDMVTVVVEGESVVDALLGLMLRPYLIQMLQLLSGMQDLCKRWHGMSMLIMLEATVTDFVNCLNYRVRKYLCQCICSKKN